MSDNGQAVLICSQSTYEYYIVKNGSTEPVGIYKGSGNGRDAPVEDDHGQYVGTYECIGSYPTLLAARAFAWSCMEYGSLVGYTHGTENLKHFLDRTGVDKYIDFHDLNSKSQHAREAKLNNKAVFQEAAEALIDPWTTGDLEMVDVFDHVVTPIQSTHPWDMMIQSKDASLMREFDDWYVAVGNYRVWSQASVRSSVFVDGATVDYQMVMTYNFRDAYRWYMTDNGKTIKESVFHLLHLCDWAQEYTMYGKDRFQAKWRTSFP